MWLRPSHLTLRPKHTSQAGFERNPRLPPKAAQAACVGYAQHGFFGAIRHCAEIQLCGRTCKSLHQLDEVAHRDCLAGADLDEVARGEAFVALKDVVIGAHDIVDVDEVAELLAGGQC